MFHCVKTLCQFLIRIKKLRLGFFGHPSHKKSEFPHGFLNATLVKQNPQGPYSKQGRWWAAPVEGGSLGTEILCVCLANHFINVSKL